VKKYRPIWPLFILLCLPALLLAQTTGKINGKITDSQTGEGLPGANLILEGTPMGCVTDFNGDFFIINVPPGTYTLRAQMIGYEVQRMTNVQVSVNRTSEYKFRLKQTVLQGEEVVIHAEKISVKKDQTSSVRNVSSEQIDFLPVESMGGVIAMQAGVVNGHFRGGRSNEVSYLIDGMAVTEAFGGEGRVVELETESIQDLEVITGTFNAEYGRAMSGVVNAVTKSGSNKYHGSVSADLANYLTSNKDIFIGLRDDEIMRNQDYKLQLSGPLLKNRLNFFFNARYQDNKNHLNGIRRFRVGDYSNFVDTEPAMWYSEHTGDSAFVPMSRSLNVSYMGKLSADLIKNVKMDFLFTRNDDEWHSYDHSYKYNPDGMAVTHRLTDMYSFEINHMISSRMFQEFKLSYMSNDHGWYVYENPLDSKYVHDRFLSDVGPGFFTGGQQKGHDVRKLRDVNVKWDLTWQLNKSHNLKGGFLYTKHDLDNQYKDIRNRYYGTDLEYMLYEPVVYPDSSVYSDIYRVKPVELSAYFQDKMEFDEMVINLGLRYDYFDPQSVYPSQRRNPANQLVFSEDPTRTSSYLTPKPQVQLSPRLGLSYQLSNAALLHFSYGHFFQMPPMYALYQNHSFQISPTDYSTTMGNVEVKAQKTVQYEIGLWQEVTKGMGLEVALFYRDIYDLLSAKVISTFNQIEYGLYSNKDYGNAKGLELKYDFVSGPFSTFINYTLQFTRGNADNPTQTFTRAGNSMDPINRLIPMSWDQRHTFNATVGYNTPRYGVSLTGYYNSGAPYTWSPIAENPVATVNLYPNNAWTPSKYSVDMAAFYERQILKNIKMRFTLNVYNLLDRLNEYGVNSQTGRSYTAIIRESDLAAHRSDFNEYIDRVHNPSMYSSPRLVKFGVGVVF
jgi:outer membrane receptor for ferrienterochelin and colicin